MTQRRVMLVAVLAAFVAANLGIVRMSAAAFSPQAPNVWTQAELAVPDAPVRASLFDIEGMLPGQPEVRCLPLHYDGAHERADLRFYASNLRGDLAGRLDVVIETGSSCDAFVPAALIHDGTLDELPGDWDEATATGPVVPGEQRAWRFRVTLRDDPTAQGLEASAEFLWEARPPA